MLQHCLFVERDVQCKGISNLVQKNIVNNHRAHIFQYGKKTLPLENYQNVPNLQIFRVLAHIFFF